MKQFDSVTMGSLDIAYSSALERGNAEVLPLHLVYGLLKNPQTYFSTVFKNEIKIIENKLAGLPIIGQSSSLTMENLRVSPKLSEWITLASSFSVQEGRSEVRESDLVRYLPKVLPELDLDYSALNEFNGNAHEERPAFLIDLNELASKKIQASH